MADTVTDAFHRRDQSSAQELHRGVHGTRACLDGGFFSAAVLTFYGCPRRLLPNKSDASQHDALGGFAGYHDAAKPIKTGAPLAARVGFAAPGPVAKWISQRLPKPRTAGSIPARATDSQATLRPVVSARVSL